jgi:hypothetical protein
MKLKLNSIIENSNGLGIVTKIIFNSNKYLYIQSN